MPKKISTHAAYAFLEGRNFRRDNTEVITTIRGGHPHAALYLHGKLIARHVVGTPHVFATLAGWPTVTTRDRLNAIADLINSPRVCQHQYRQYIDSEPTTYITATQWFTLTKETHRHAH